jgi:hypothetical protein
MTKTNSVRNTVLVTLLGLISLYALFHFAGGKIINKNTSDSALQARAGLLDEVDNERLKQESIELDQIQNDLDQTDLGALPQ